MEKDKGHIEAKNTELITASQAWHYHIVPSEVKDGLLIFYTDEKYNSSETEQELSILFGKRIELINTDSTILLNALSRYYPVNGKTRVDTLRGKEDFLAKLIDEAKTLQSSDIHLEVYEDECRVRYRIDGKLIEKYVIKKEEYQALTNKIKIKANLDIAEKRLPQDGRIIYGKGNQAIDIRLSILPTMHGEKAVMRLLNKEASNLNLEKLGMSEQQKKIFTRAVSKSHGIILISGPTGSGKTTTLYATLNLLNSTESNILTIEDPIEYTLKGVNQVQLREKIGMTFARALRTFLRQDPDIIMLGEIRDPETAQMATRAALTGHLVLSTIHTNSAYGILARLSDMGVPEYLVSSTLNIALAQRLVRLLCPECKQKEELNPDLLPNGFRKQDLPEYHYVKCGCEACYFTGYKGRTAIYEMIEIDDQISNKIRKKEISIEYIRDECNTKFLADSAMELFVSGKTTLNEIYSILITNHH